MPDRQVAIARRVSELEAEAARELRSFTLAALEELAAQAAGSGQVQDDSLIEVVTTRLETALAGSYTLMLLDVTQRVGVSLETAVRPGIQDALREAASDLVPSAREAIADVVAEAYRRGWSTDRTARQIRRYITLAPSQVKRMRTLATNLRRDPVAAAEIVGLTVPANPSTGDLNRVLERYRVRLERERALKVAQQELWRASQVAEHEFWVQAVEAGEFARGDITKHWNDQEDTQVRSSHRSIKTNYPDGIGLDEVFVTSRGPLRHPLDPRGSADNVVGCRCWLTYKVRGEIR